MVASPQSLHEFVNYRLQHIKGRERSESQIFLDRFFQAFGHQGINEVGAKCDFVVSKGSNKGKTGFADLVWKPRVLIEMKKILNPTLHKGSFYNAYYLCLPKIGDYYLRIRLLAVSTSV